MALPLYSASSILNPQCEPQNPSLPSLSLEWGTCTCMKGCLLRCLLGHFDPIFKHNTEERIGVWKIWHYHSFPAIYLYILNDVICYDIWHDMTWHDMTWHGMVWYMIRHDMIWYVIYDTWYMIYDIWHDMTLYGMVWYDTWYDMMRCDAIRYDTKRYDMIWYYTIWYIC